MSNKKKRQQESLLGKTRDVISDNLFLIIASIISAFILFFVPQVTNLLRPTLTWNQWTFWFLLWLAGLAFVYVTTMLRFIWPNIQFFGVFKPAGFINGWLIWIARKLSGQADSVMGYFVPVILFLIGLGLLLSVGIDLNTPYVLFGGFVRIIGLWLIFVAIWLFAGKFLGANRMLDGKTLSRRMRYVSDGTDTESDIEPRSAWQACGEVLSWMAMMVMILESFWITASYELPGASYRLYSIAALIHIAILWIVIAALADFLQKTTPLPARLLTVVVIVAIVVHGSFNNISDDEAVSLSTSSEDMLPQAAIQHDWLASLDERVSSTPEGPVVMVAASGGGSRAALFTSLVLQMLATEPMKDFPEARRMDIAANTDQGTWGDHIVLLSSVSGGSLASARYVWNNGSTAGEQLPDLRYSVRADLLDLTHDKLTRWSSSAASKFDCATSNSNDAADLVFAKVLEQEQKQLQKIAQQVDRLRDGPGRESVRSEGSDASAAVVAAAFSSRFADDMSMDFMAPILRGFLTPLASRGEGLYHFWQHRFGWAEIHQQGYLREPKVTALSGQADETSTKPRPLPLVLFNTSDADGGRRVIIGFPRLARGSLVGSPHLNAPADGRDGEYSPLPLSDFAADPLPDISLSRAVRLSSNFPFGFGVSTLSASSTPKLTIHQCAPAIRGQSERTALRLLDGGVVDNTGIDTLHAIVKSLETSAAANPIGRESRLLEKLRRRGVVFIEIDSGAKPSGSGGGPFAAATRPLSALSNAVYTNALRTSDRQQLHIEESLSDSIEARMVATIQDEPEALQSDPIQFEFTKEELIAATTAVLHPRQFGDQPLSVVRFRFTCNHLRDTRSDVMTALALGPDDKSTVIAMYLSEALRWQNDLDAFRSDYRKNIGRKGLNGFSRDDVAALLGHLLRRAKTELQQADLQLRLLRESWDRLGEPEESEKVAQLNERLVRPVVLLLAVREIARSSSMVVEGKDEQFAKLSEIVNGILADDESGIPNLVGTQHTIPSNIDTTKIIAPQYIPDDALEIYSKINQAIDQADSAESSNLWRRQKEFGEQRDRTMQAEQMKQERSRARTEFFNAIE